MLISSRDAAQRYSRVFRSLYCAKPSDYRSNWESLRLLARAERWGEGRGDSDFSANPPRHCVCRSSCSRQYFALSAQLLMNAENGQLNFPITRASSDGRRNTPLIGWFHNSLQKEPFPKPSSSTPKQGGVFFESAFVNEFSL